MYISKADLEFLVELEYKLYETKGFTEYVERLWKLNEKLINNRKSSNERTLKYITEKRKTNPMYGRSKREIENRQKAEQKRLNKKRS